MFTHLHGHTHYSFLQGIGKVSDLIARTQELEMNAIAVTDYNGLYGAVDFFQYASKVGIKPIIGAELSFVTDYSMIKNMVHPSKIVLLAKNNIGYHHIVKIVSQAHLHHHNDIAWVDLQTLKSFAEGVIILVGGEYSYLAMLVQHAESVSSIVELLNNIANTVGKENFFVEYEAQRWGNNPQRKKLSEVTRDIIQTGTFSCVVNSNFHYIHEADHDAFLCAMCIKKGILFSDRHTLNMDRQGHLMSQQEIEDILQEHGLERSQIEEMIATNNRVATSIDMKMEFGNAYFPDYHQVETIKKLYEKFQELEKK